MEQLAQGTHFLGRFGAERGGCHGRKSEGGEGGESVVLVGEPRQPQARAFPGARHGSEVHVRGEVLRAGRRQRVVLPRVAAVGGDGSGGPRRVVARGLRVAVIHEQHPSEAEFFRHGAHPRTERRAHFRCEPPVARRHREVGIRAGHLGEDERIAVEPDAALAPGAAVAREEFHGKRVEQLVGEKEAGERRQIVLVRDVGEVVRPGGEGFLLERAKGRQRLDDDGARERGRPRGKHVGHELAVRRPLLDEREIVGPPERLPHLGELRGQQAPEDRADAHAGEKVAALSGARRAPRVVASGAVERGGHELVEADWPGVRDAPAEMFRGGVRAG